MASSSLKVEVVPCRQDHAYLIKNMYPLYLHDLSAFLESSPNEHATLEPDPVSDLVGQGVR